MRSHDLTYVSLSTFLIFQSSEFEKPRLTLVGGGAAYARFGTSIMSLGDISKDSYTG